MTEREIFRSECQIENLKGVIRAATETVAAARHALELETERLNKGREDLLGRDAAEAMAVDRMRRQLAGIEPPPWVMMYGDQRVALPEAP